MLTVALHDRHGQPRQPNIEVRHCRRIDDAQAYPLTWAEEARPIFRSPVPVDEEAICRSGHVRNVGRVHPHRAPLQALTC